MGWVNVPVTIIAAYIALGYAAIGNEIENPFGPEVNDLPLELYCARIASDIAIIRLISHNRLQIMPFAQTTSSCTLSVQQGGSIGSTRRLWILWRLWKLGRRSVSRRCGEGSLLCLVTYLFQCQENSLSMVPRHMDKVRMFSSSKAPV
jgi:hypothetical protein